MLDGRQHFERQDRTAILKRSRFQLRCETGQTLRRPRRQSRPMREGHYIFAEVMRHFPLTTFRRCVARYGGDHKIKSFSCLDQFRCLAFAQLTWRESLRDIEACLRAQSAKLYHLGFRCPQISRNTMANANAERDWRIYADFAQHLIRMARGFTPMSPLALEGMIPSTPWILRPSTCACRCFRGLRSDRPRPRSNCIRCSIYAATFRRLSSSATEKCTM